MKIGTIEKLCKSAKRISIVNDGERSIQWISDGYCMYPLFKLPKLNAENIFAIFDIPEDKQGKIQFDVRDDFPVSLNFGDVDGAEHVITPDAYSINANGITLVPFRCSLGVMLIDKKYLGVFDGEVTFYERCTSFGWPYLVAKEGMFISGVILPYTADYKLSEWLVNTGEGVDTMIRNHRGEADEDLFDEDELDEE